MMVRCRAVALVATALIAAAAAMVPARAEEWRPGKLTILLGHDAGGSEGRAAEVLAEAWARTLRAPVVVAARGRASALLAAGEFTRSVRDGRVVLAGDIGALALAYARERPTWTWARSFEHFGAYVVDPSVLFVASRGGIENIDEIVAIAHAQPFRVAVGAWNSLETYVLHDAALQARLRFATVPVGTGASLLGALTRGHVRLAFGRQSTFVHDRRQVRVLAVAGTLGAGSDFFPLDTVLHVTTGPAGRIDVITVHADFQRLYPDRYESLKRSFVAARDDPNYREALEELGLGAEGTGPLRNEELFNAVRQWWDVIGRAAPTLGSPPPEIRARGKITRIDGNGRTIRYLALDGKIHELEIDPEMTVIAVAGTVAGAAAGGAHRSSTLKVGMLCDIAWPAAFAVQASRLSCK